ncbi:hypothetical protein R3W88_027918 [Solanum pinnatisectum]|uniref:GS catalytic domain-containing protein n=1 Tax=Solanum pinnatisectum TaxID=50273 RepID=A0AAV9LHI9_9SOLN|nr:hypothetical protein R3W88_027918 [Solanum pinnatisectum]
MSNPRPSGVIPRERLSFVKKHGLGLSPACLAALSSVSNCPAEGTNLGFTGMIRIIPDLPTRYKPWEYCPREVFRRVTKILKDEFDLVVNVGFEIEFYLLKSVIKNGKEEWLPIDKTSYCSTSGFDVSSLILEDIVTYFQTMNITVEQASTVISSLIYAHEVIKSVARQHGQMATFVPKYAEDEDGSGSHVHISLSRGMEKTFLCYEHLVPKTRNAAYLCWGKENTEAPLRTASPPGIADDLVSHFEIKAFDASTNPYIGLASIIISGVDGLQKDLSLPKPVGKDSDVSGENLRSVPDSISESLIALGGDTLFSEVMSENLLTAIKGIRKMEVKNYCEPERDYNFYDKELYKDPLKDIIFKF